MTMSTDSGRREVVPEKDYRYRQQDMKNRSRAKTVLRQPSLK
jgi:hypothetical protein